MLFILDGTPGSDVAFFLQRLQEETIDCVIILYEDWLKHQDDHRNMKGDCYDEHEELAGIILMRVRPEIAYKRLQNCKDEWSNGVSFEAIARSYQEKEQFFIENKNKHIELQNVPLLVLNGNIDFQTDFSQFYNHLFYIRKFVNDMKKRKDIAQGVYKEKAIRKCC